MSDASPTPLSERLREAPVIAAVRESRHVDAALKSPVRALFMMGGSLSEAADITRKAHGAGKAILFHVELVKGLGRDREAIEYLAHHIRPDGVVATKATLLGAARKLGLFSVLQIFMIDTQAYVTGLKNIAAVRPDAIEIMPGLMPRVVAQLRAEFDGPIFTAGLVKLPEEIRALRAAGADGVAISEQTLWEYTE